MHLTDILAQGIRECRFEFQSAKTAFEPQRVAVFEGGEPDSGRGCECVQELARKDRA
jgi:hypothetical protein